MKAKEFNIVLLLLISLVLPQLHMIMNNMPVNKVDLILFNDVIQDIQWYVKDTLGYLSSLVIFIAIRILLPYKLKILATLIIVSITLDIANYWLFYHQFDWIYKSIIIVISIILINNEK